jgi:hypothetical protein
MKYTRKIIDVCGNGHSGHSALVDLLGEVKDVHTHYSLYHFELFRQPGGIIDLIRSMDNDWSEITFDYNYKKFDLLVGNILSGIEKNVGINSSKIIKEFQDKIISGYLETDWFDDLNFHKDYFTKLISRILILYRNKTDKLLKRKCFYPSSKVYQYNVGFTLIEIENFVNKLLFHDQEESIQAVVLNNSLEPYKRSKYILDAVPNFYSITVLRDPRDIYASLHTDNVFKRDFEKFDKSFNFYYLNEQRKGFLGANDISTFIERQKASRSNLLDHPRNLIINFEDLIEDYDKTVTRVFNFLGLKKENHIYKHDRLDPSKSIKNIGLWKKCSKKQEIKLITSKLYNYINE